MPLIIWVWPTIVHLYNKGFKHRKSAPKTTKLFYIFAETLLPRKILINAIFAVAARHTINGYICSSTLIQRG
jgi:hypothetical protein